MIWPASAGPAEGKSRGRGIGRFFSSIPTWALFILIVVGSALVVGVGAWIGLAQYQRGERLPESPLDTAVGATFGLLAFMLGFTFSLTWTRYTRRSNLVIMQAKAISTCYLRTSLLPEKQKLEIRKLLYEYTQLLLDLLSVPELEKLLARIGALHLLIWKQTVMLIREDMDAELRALFTSSVNELIGLAEERRTIALVFGIPNPIWITLLLLAAIGMLAFGYQTGISGIRRVFEIPLLPMAFGLVIVLIAELNTSGTQSRFKVTQKPLQDVLGLMGKELY